MAIPEIQERKRRILSAIIQTYVDQAAPVSSQAIADQLGSRVSSATIRNVMAELEDEGLITHPHTSAGRVPTDKGYRFFVDALMDQLALQPDDIAAVRQLFARDYHEFSELLERASRVLASMTSHVAIGLAPALRRESLQRFEVVSLGAGKVLGILRTTDGFVRSHVLDFGEELQVEELAALMRFINSELTGVELSSIEGVLTRRLLAQHDAFFYQLKRALQLVQLSLVEMDGERLYYDGLGNLLSHPEFRTDVDGVRAVVDILEAKTSFLSVMEQELEPGVHITIGQEHASPALQSCSIVSASYGIGGQVLGRVAVIGPKRMAYAKVASLVDYLARQMSEYVTHAFRE